MATALEIVMAPFFAVVDFVLAAPVVVIVATALVVGVFIATLVAMA